MFGITTTALQFVIPFLIITFCYVKICAKLSDRARTIPGNVSARREEQERERTRKTNGMLISMVVIFVISWLPLNMVNLLADFYEEASRWRNQRAIFLISHAIAMSSTCYNPFLYAWLNENFRKEFKEVLPCFVRGSKANHSSGIGGGDAGGGTL
ncbi:GPCR Neuropeptide Y-like protein, partial [Euroglyphus maynei]